MDPERVNVNGGAIALGHPLGATGAMLIGTLVDELERRNKRYGMATMCIGIGMGITTIIERYIRKYPQEWGWMHRRWKTRPDDERTDS